MQSTSVQSNDMKTFTVIWFGQLVSLFGTAMTRFALLIWAYQQTGEATTIALLGFFGFGPYILLSPIAGVWIDRLDRRWVMVFADLAAGLMTVWMLVLFTAGHLQIWHLYLAEGLSGAFEAFQANAYSAATTTLLPKEQFMRANGMRSLAFEASRVVAPFVAGLALPFININGVMALDIVSFVIAVSSLLVVRIPRPQVTKEGAAAKGRIWREMWYGFRYIFQRRGLFGLMIVFVGMNFFATLTYFSILPAMILARSNGNELSLAIVQSALGLGGVVGGLIVSLWGGPKRRIHSILAGAGLSFLLGDFLFAIGQNTLVWGFAGFISTFFIPFIVAGDRAIWQAKVAPDVQGRVFSALSGLREALVPIGYLLAGPLADRLFEPAMAADGSLSAVFGGLVGVGPGAGMGLMFVCTSLLGTAMSLSGYIFSSIRNVEDDIPDYEAPPITDDRVVVTS